MEESVEQKAQLIEEIVSVYSGVWRAFHAASARAWLEVDVTMPQLKIIFLLYHSGQISMGNLANALGLRLSTLTGIIDRLVEQELVVRNEDPNDRRLVIVRLTDAGNRMAGRLQDVERSSIASLFVGLDVEELTLVAKALNIVHKAALSTWWQGSALNGRNG